MAASKVRPREDHKALAETPEELIGILRDDCHPTHGRESWLHFRKWVASLKIDALHQLLTKREMVDIARAQGEMEVLTLLERIPEVLIQEIKQGERK